ncbi:MAG TPA: glutamyl-tRNA reductase [Dinghuibacter sp.]|uniref:glutamyl-tRNA reductase n=1 Tax=Dinghuibacter sp. TaxID=2024697 RepID=UPI002D040EA8|nr:glutamyl-tRNA reductase [Dinghuibacter sp.]HTJ12721.1 glutamyl-tRNA reductase [Dinghuibacter sp.]
MSEEISSESSKTIDQFFIAGISYKKTDADVRSLFAINQEQYGQLIAAGHARNLHELFVLSTCNRTEIYGFAPDAGHLITLLCQFTKGDESTFRANAFCYQGWQAVRHLCQVSAGLDSQILGDYEINGQIKVASKVIKEQGGLGPFTERLINTSLQLSKSIKNNTGLSSGTVSVAFAAIQYLKNRLNPTPAPKIVLVGVGKIGRSTCKNVLAHLETRNIVVINRTTEVARAFALEQGIRYAPITELRSELADADAVIVSTNAPVHTVAAADLAGTRVQLVLDLSIPFNAEPAIAQLPGVTLINVDHLSKETDATITRRKAEVPKAERIVAEFVEEFKSWYAMRQQLGMIRAVRHTLSRIPSDHLPLAVDGAQEERMQKVINNLAAKIRRNNPKGCCYLEALHDYITPGV